MNIDISKCTNLIKQYISYNDDFDKSVVNVDLALSNNLQNFEMLEDEMEFHGKKRIFKGAYSIKEKAFKLNKKYIDLKNKNIRVEGLFVSIHEILHAIFSLKPSYLRKFYSGNEFFDEGYIQGLTYDITAKNNMTNNEHITILSGYIPQVVLSTLLKNLVGERITNSLAYQPNTQDKHNNFFNYINMRYVGNFEQRLLQQGSIMQEEYYLIREGDQTKQIEQETVDYVLASFDNITEYILLNIAAPKMENMAQHDRNTYVFSFIDKLRNLQNFKFEEADKSPLNSEEILKIYIYIIEKNFIELTKLSEQEILTKSMENRSIFIEKLSDKQIYQQYKAQKHQRRGGTGQDR